MPIPEPIHVHALLDWAERGGFLFSLGVLIACTLFFGAILYVAHTTADPRPTQRPQRTRRS